MCWAAWSHLVAACSGLRKLTLHGLILLEGDFFSGMASACTQLTHLKLDGVELRDPAAQYSLGQLATGLPALQS